ncbi:MAG TPA: HlyD family secretion protein [Verrucomicrobiae bacterium]|jgi:membrane fusion protein (multidrug efflux system)|nr:HlyD family secretion protein [Verrucomicrobiae bacterium]
MAAPILDSEKKTAQADGNHVPTPKLVTAQIPEAANVPVEVAARKSPGRLAIVKKHPWLALLTLCAVAAGSVLVVRYLGSYESTDDAEVDGHLNPISARISGTIVNVNPDVLNNHYVAAGTVLAEIDPADFQADVARAQAEFQRLRASAASAHQDVGVVSSSSTGRLEVARSAVTEAFDGVSSAKAALTAAQARVTQAEANYTRVEADRQRYERLLAKREISQSEYDRIATQAATDHAAVDAARADYTSAQKGIDQAESRLAQRKSDLLAARSAPEQVASSQARAAAAISEADRAHAQLTTAELNLSYTKIMAPVSGIVGRKSLEVGQRIQPGQQLLIIIPVDDIWITANFKETQLRKMHPGQPVTVHVDSYNRDYHGQVDTLAGATGSRFSLLPAENATGNYVRVVQRIPVRIVLDPKENSDHLLRPGMSVEATVKLRGQ